jgi:helicase SWR1
MLVTQWDDIVKHAIEGGTVDYSRHKWALEVSRALETERDFHVRQSAADQESAHRGAQRALAIVERVWLKVHKGFRVIIAVDAKAEKQRHHEALQSEFMRQSAELIAHFGQMDDDEASPFESSLTLLNTENGRRPLRQYQRTALSWLMKRYDKGINSILADEMGLGKTVQTIALLAHFAEHKGDWGPHLIVVPTPVVVNWCLEFKRWAPGFNVVQYIGTAEERRKLRVGWSHIDAFDVCVTSFNILVQDKTVFRRKSWGFLIVDEAHHLKNFASQKYQTMFDLQAQYRLLLTGTPLQNSVMELWALFHFVMPQASVFQNDALFREWFSNPLSQMVAGQAALNQEIVMRLHALLRPFMLRRLKSEVARDLPTKKEVVVNCHLSRRQRAMYQGYLEMAETKATLQLGSFQGMVAVLLALRKVCNHPDLFEERAVMSPYYQDSPLQVILPADCAISHPQPIISLWNDCHRGSVKRAALHPINWKEHVPSTTIFDELIRNVDMKSRRLSADNSVRGTFVRPYNLAAPVRKPNPAEGLMFTTDLCAMWSPTLRHITIVRDRVIAAMPRLGFTRMRGSAWSDFSWSRAKPSHNHFVFPDSRLVVHDCGKLQVLLPLLKRLRAEGHRCVIFTQFTHMLSVLEKFLAMFGLTYFRFDGSTKPELRQTYVERFNRDERVFCLLLSTRAGGIGLNLVGADTVIFYDSDWNPAMDLQAQDRCHRIGQTRSVTIYRLICGGTVESAILRKARERKKLNNIVIRGGAFGQSDREKASVGRRQLLQFFCDLDEDQIDIGAMPDSAEPNDNTDPDAEWIAATAAVEDVDDQRDLSNAKQEADNLQRDEQRDARVTKARAPRTWMVQVQEQRAPGSSREGL